MKSRPSPNDGDTGSPVHLSDDELSAYINGDTTELLEVRRLQAHLNDCPECRDRLAELTTVVSMLNRIETPNPPRSFKLDPRMVGLNVVQSDPWIVRVQPVMRRLTAIAAVLLLILVAADVVSHQRTVGGSRSPSLSVATSSQTSNAGPAISVAGSSARDSSSTAISGASAFTAPKAPATGTPTRSEGQPAGATQSHPMPGVSTPPTDQAGASYWRLTEFAVGVIVVWLLFFTIALPKLYPRRRV